MANTDADLNFGKPRFMPHTLVSEFCTTDDHERAALTYGCSFRDRVRGFNCQFPNPPDVIAYPRTEEEFTRVLDYCAKSNIVVILYGSTVVVDVELPVSFKVDRLQPLGPGSGDRRNFAGGTNTGRRVGAGAGSSTASHGFMLRSGDELAPLPGQRRDSQTPAGVTIHTDSTKLSMVGGIVPTASGDNPFARREKVKALDRRLRVC